MSAEPIIRDALLLRCKGAIQELHNEVDQAQAECRQLSQANEETQRENKKLIDRIENYERDQLKLQDEIQRWKTKLNSSEQKIDYLEEQIRNANTLQAQIDQMKIQNQDLQTKNRSLSRQLEEALNDIQDNENIKGEWEREIQYVQQRIKEFQTKNQALQMQIQQRDEQQKQNANVIEQLEIQINEMQNHIEEVESQKQQIKRQLDQSKQQHNDGFIERLKRQVEQLKDENDKVQRENDQTLKRKVQELINQSDLEKDKIRNEFVQEMQALQKLADQLQLDINKVRTDKDRIQKELYECREEILKKEYIIKELNEDNLHRLDQTQKSNVEEIRKLQSIIDDQSELIRSYERIVEKEKEESSKKFERITTGELKYKEQIIDLTNKNQFLQNKLMECQQALRTLQGDVNLMFQKEEAKYQLRIQELELQLEHTQKSLIDKEKDIDRYKQSMEKKQLDYSYFAQDRSVLERQINDYQHQIEDLERQLQIKEREFDSIQAIFQKKVDDLNYSLDMERKKFLAQSQAEIKIEEKIKQVEDYYIQELDFLKNELFRKEKDFDMIKLKYDQSIQKILCTRQDVAQGVLQENKPPIQNIDITRSQKPLFTNEKIKQKTLGDDIQDRLPQEKISTQRFESSFLRVPDQFEQSIDQKQKMDSKQSKSIEGRKGRTESDLIKFQNVIQKMEFQLEKMQNELHMQERPQKKK